MTESTRDNLEPDVTFVPPRYWWLKRLGAAGLLSVVALVGLRLWWGHVAEARL